MVFTHSVTGCCKMKLVNWRGCCFCMPFACPSSADKYITCKQGVWMLVDLVPWGFQLLYLPGLHSWHIIGKHGTYAVHRMTGEGNLDVKSNFSLFFLIKKYVSNREWAVQKRPNDDIRWPYCGRPELTLQPFSELICLCTTIACI